MRISSQRDSMKNTVLLIICMLLISCNPLRPENISDEILL